MATRTVGTMEFTANQTTRAVLESLAGSAALVTDGTFLVIATTPTLRRQLGLSEEPTGKHLDELTRRLQTPTLKPLRSPDGRLLGWLARFRECAAMDAPPAQGASRPAFELPPSSQPAEADPPPKTGDGAGDGAEHLRAKADRHAAELEAVFAAVADPLLVYDRDGRVIRANPAARRTFGFDPRGMDESELLAELRLEDLRGRPISLHQLPMNRALRGETATGEPLRLRGRGGGQHLILQPTAAPLRVAGKSAGAVGLWRDLSQREAILARLEKQTSALVEADRRKNDFLALLGHELRNPLAAISNGAQLLARIGLAGAQERCLQIILRQTRQLSRMVDDLLDVARIARGRIQLRLQVLDLRTVVGRAVEAIRPALEERRHQLALSVPEEALLVEGDPTRLEQILSNLLQNAIKYSEAGGQLWLAVGRDAKGSFIRVRDSGIGMSGELLSRLFEPFTQAGRSLARSAGGLGLGLALVKQLVELHQGGIEAHSDGPGQGSQFVVRLPGLEASLKPELPPVPSTSAGGPRRILLVEDQSDVAYPIAEQLRFLGHQVRVAASGAEALEATGRELPEVIFLDIGLPDIDGYELARQIRTRHGTEFAIIALTGYGRSEDLARSRAAGFAKHLVKPVSFDALRELLTTLA